MADKLIFSGYKISAHSQQLDGGTWTGSYIIDKDDQVLRVRYSITCRRTAELAEASALVFGIQLVDNCVAGRRAVTQAESEM